MASFQGKTGWKRLTKRGNKKLSFRLVPTQSAIENSEKIAKKFKKLKDTVMASFDAKIGWKRWRKRENKNYRSVPFQIDA